MKCSECTTESTEQCFNFSNSKMLVVRGKVTKLCFVTARRKAKISAVPKVCLAALSPCAMSKELVQL